MQHSEQEQSWSWLESAAVGWSLQELAGVSGSGPESVGAPSRGQGRSGCGFMAGAAVECV